MDSEWIDNALDRVHELAEQGCVDEAESLYREIKQYISQYKNEDSYITA